MIFLFLCFFFLLLVEEITASLRQWMENQLNAYSHLTRSYFNKICLHNMASSVDLQLATLIHESFASYEKFNNDFSNDVNTHVIKMGQVSIFLFLK